MYIVHVSILVKEEYLSSFKQATIINASNSLKESGVIRFDVLQDSDVPCQFVLVEMYNTQADQLKHRETEHFKNWRAAITNMLVQPYSFKKYNNVFTD
ncbi:putative quinol monooxygenase [Domibacillus aminovorans]|uniref:ABM domain-containing protein n=1 Tax=Domibacillus aminovorans TaxID=29332 RepID=A0A177LBU0_9BACI|nr:putative quinol monooxygenase [Domibacillus aminovorans]OAH63169.1 hypothetical protein AWH49_06335 [Domibacillus aminovorans]